MGSDCRHGWRPPRRDHGDPFPLPALGSRDFDLHEFCPEQQRRANQARAALNHLAAAHPNSIGVMPHAKGHSDRYARSAPQEAVLASVCRRVAQAGVPEAGATPESSLRALLASKDLYSQEPKNLAAYDEQKLKVAKGELRPQCIASALPPEAAALFRHPDRFIERSEAELEDIRNTSDPIKPYWDPALSSSRTKRWALFKRLWQVKLLGFRRSIKSKIGIFFVKKKRPGEIRMVIDARQACRYHKRPPVTRLASAGALIDVDLAEEIEPEGVGSICGWDLHGQEADVADCFWNFTIDSLADWFGIDEAKSVGELKEMGIDVREIWCPVAQGMIPTTPDMILFPCIRGMCMGWSWSLYFANEAVAEMVARARDGQKDQFIRERCPAPRITPSRPIAGVYVDNITLIGSSAADVDGLASKIVSQAARQEIPLVWSSNAAVKHLESVGIVLDLERRVAYNKPTRTWRFALATDALLARHSLRGEHLNVWLGHAVSLLTLGRPALSIFRECYRFVEAAWGRRMPMTRALRSELRIAQGAVFLAEAGLARPYCHRVYASDASGSGYGVVYTQACEKDIRVGWNWRERWRYQTVRT